MRSSSKHKTSVGLPEQSLPPPIPGKLSLLFSELLLVASFSPDKTYSLITDLVSPLSLKMRFLSRTLKNID